MHSQMLETVEMNSGVRESPPGILRIPWRLLKHKRRRPGRPRKSSHSSKFRKLHLGGVVRRGRPPSVKTNGQAKSSKGHRHKHFQPPLSSPTLALQNVDLSPFTSIHICRTCRFPFYDKCVFGQSLTTCTPPDTHELPPSTSSHLKPAGLPDPHIPPAMPVDHKMTGGVTQDEHKSIPTVIPGDRKPSQNDQQDTHSATLGDPKHTQLDGMVDIKPIRSVRPDEHTSTDDSITPDDHIDTCQSFKPVDHQPTDSDKPDAHIGTFQSVKLGDRKPTSSVNPDDDMSTDQSLKPGDNKPTGSVKPNDHRSTHRTCLTPLTSQAQAGDLKVDQLFDVLAVYEQWHGAKVSDIKLVGETVVALFKYHGASKQYREYIPVPSPRVAPFGAHRRRHRHDQLPAAHALARHAWTILYGGGSADSTPVSLHLGVRR
eukprot:103242_1